MQAEGTAKPCVAQKLLCKLHDEYNGTELYKTFEEVTIDVTGIAYTGMFKARIVVCRPAYALMGNCG